MPICGTPTISQRISGYLADNRVTSGELADLTGALIQSKGLSVDDAAALADLVVNRQSQMSGFTRFALGLVMQVMPAQMKTTLEVGAAAGDGRITRDEVATLLESVSRNGISDAERRGLRAALKAFDSKFDPGARLILTQVLQQQCVDTFTP
jgi:hypothetical protein